MVVPWQLKRKQFWGIWDNQEKRKWEKQAIQAKQSGRRALNEIERDSMAILVKVH